MTLRNLGHGSLAGGPIMLRMGWPHDPAKLPETWPHEAANRQRRGAGSTSHRVEGTTSSPWAVQEAAGTREEQAANGHRTCTRAGRICLEHRAATEAAGGLKNNDPSTTTRTVKPMSDNGNGKGNPRGHYGNAPHGVGRPRLDRGSPRRIRSCGSQPAHISLIHRRNNPRRRPLSSPPEGVSTKRRRKKK